jgi:integrase
MAAYKQKRRGIEGWEQRVQVRGRRVRLWARTKVDLQQLILDLEDKAQRQRRGYRQPKRVLTYNELCELVLRLYPHRERSRTALADTLRYSRVWFGEQGLFDFDREDVEEWLLSLRQKTPAHRALSPYSRRNALKAMRQALSWAESHDYVDRNVAAAVPAPDVVDRPDPFDSWQDVFKVARKFSWAPYGRAVRFAGGMALRPQEWMVLRERDLDRKEGTLTISRTWSQAEGEVPLAKTDSSLATIYLSDIALEVLDELPQSLDPDQLLFPSPLGKVINLGNWRRREWTEAVEGAGLRYRPPKALRHTFATLALKAGVPLEDVSRMLRHDSVKTTERYYAKVVPEVKRRAVERLNELAPRFTAKAAKK